MGVSTNGLRLFLKKEIIAADTFRQTEKPTIFWNCVVFILSGFKLILTISIYLKKGFYKFFFYGEIFGRVERLTFITFVLFLNAEHVSIYAELLHLFILYIFFSNICINLSTFITFF